MGWDGAGMGLKAEAIYGPGHKTLDVLTMYMKGKVYYIS